VQQEIRTATLPERLDALTSQPEAMIALPGGIGTLCEISLALNRMLISPAAPKPLILLVAHGKKLPPIFRPKSRYDQRSDQERVKYARTPAEAVTFLVINLSLGFLYGKEITD